MPVHFFTQLADSSVHYIGTRVKIVVPDSFHDHGSGNHVPGIPDQVFQQGKFLGLQVDLLTIASDTSGQQVQLQIGETQR